jgi:uncharacterized protein YegL
MEQEKGAPGTVITSFYIPGEEGISEYWRRHKSTVASLELARLLAALRKLTGYLGMNVGSIIWEGMKSPEETSAIILDTSQVRGKYPVPASKTDYVVGVTVREAYRRIEWSEKAEQLAGEQAGKLEAPQRHKFQQYLEIAERIYLDTLANRSVLGLYAEVARRNDFNRAQKHFLPPPSVEELLHLWWLLAADRCGCKYQEGFSVKTWEQATAEQAALYGEPLRLLNSIIGRLLNECPSRRSVLERCHYRSELYMEIWQSFLDIVKFWPADRQAALMEGEGEPYPYREPAARISAATLRAIEAALAESQDLTAEVKRVCEGDEGTVTIKTGKIILPLEEKLDRQLYLHLKASLRQRSRQRNVISRGLKSGKIDPRRLYRAPLTGEVFLYKKAVYEMDYDIVLLIDASGSMVGPKWKNAQRVFNALYEALQELNRNTSVFAYNEAFDICYLTELSRKGRLYTVVPRGKTASGEAIIATALMIKQRERRRRPLLIHLTDGASNWGSEVRHAIEYCRKEHMGLITLGLGCSKESRVELKREYGDQVRFIDDIKTLPRKFAELVACTTRLY